MKTKSITVPFAHFRALLPADGLRIVVWRGRKRWPKNETEFMQYETAELSFGRAIRAQEKHRNSERSLSPGILCHPGYLQLRGGWAAHKHVKIHNDFFDGEFHANLLLSLVRGKLHVEMRDLRLTWNASFVAKLVDFTGMIRAQVMGLVEKEVQNRINAELKRQVDAAVKDLLKRVPQAQVARDRTSIALLPDAIKIVIHYEIPILAASATRLHGTNAKTVAKTVRGVAKASKQSIKPVSKTASSKAAAKTTTRVIAKRGIKPVR